MPWAPAPPHPRTPSLSLRSPQPLLRVNFVACRCERTRGARAFATGGAPAGEAPASSGNEPGRARGKRSAGHRPDRSRREIRKGVNRAREDPRAAQRKTPNANRMDEGLASALLRAPPGGMGEDEQLTVVFVGAECAPWSKAGGLGDVMQALPVALAARGHRVITVTPRYAFYSDVPSTNVRVPLELPRDAQRDLGKGASHATLYARVQGGVARVFVGHPVFRAQEHRDSHAVYGAGYSDAGDGLDLMYSVLCQAALAAPALLESRAWQALCPDAPPPAPGVAMAGPGGERLVFVLNDWPSAPLALRLKKHVRNGAMAARYRRALSRRADGDSPGVAEVGMSGSSDSDTDAVLAQAAHSWGPMSESDLPRLRGDANVGLSGHRLSRQQRWAARMLRFAETLEIATSRAALVLCIHNLAYQGSFPGSSAAAALCLSQAALDDLLQLPDWVRRLDGGAAGPRSPGPRRPGRPAHLHSMSATTGVAAGPGPRRVASVAAAGTLTGAAVGNGHDLGLALSGASGLAVAAVAARGAVRAAAAEGRAAGAAVSVPAVPFSEPATPTTQWCGDLGSEGGESVTGAQQGDVLAGEVANGALESRVSEPPALVAAVNGAVAAAGARGVSDGWAGTAEGERKVNDKQQAGAETSGKALGAVNGALGASAANGAKDGHLGPLGGAGNGDTNGGVEAERVRGSAGESSQGGEAELRDGVRGNGVEAATPSSSEGGRGGEEGSGAVEGRAGALESGLRGLWRTGQSLMERAMGWATEQLRWRNEGPLSAEAEAARAMGPRRLPPSARRVLESAAMQRGDVKANWLQAAIRLSDMRLTVSPSYAEEVLTGGSTGAGLSQVLQDAGGIHGIVNGIDLREWDPARDEFLPAEARYSVETVSAGKAACKALVQRELGLVVSDREPLVVFVGRLENQKGVDILLSSLPGFMAPKLPAMPGGFASFAADDPFVQTALAGPGAMPYQPSGLMRKAIELLAEVQREHLVMTCPTPQYGKTDAGQVYTHPQVVVLGTGKQWLEGAIRDLSATYPARAVGLAKFDIRLSHLLMAAADYCVVPSRFEPCGLVAQCAMRYGAIPIVSTIGGMKDFVSPSLGYLMGPVGSTTGPERMRESVALMVAAMHQALADYNTPDFYRRRRACMMQDVGWAGPAKLWEAAMRGLVELGRSVRGGEGSR